MPIFTLLWVLSAGAFPATLVAQQQGTEIDPAKLLDGALRTLESRSSVAAKIRHKVHLFDKHLAGFGSYVEQRRGPNHLIRLQLRTQLGDQTSSLLQVSDGRFLWTYRKLQEDAKLTRIDVAKVMRALQAGRTSNPAQMAGVNALPSLGGLPRLLRGLRDSFDFTHAEPAQLGKQGRPAWKLHGRWNTGQLAKLLPDQEAALRHGRPPDLTKLAAHLPGHVVLLLGQEDGFPYRVEYRRTGGADTRALVTMELFDVHYPRDVDPRQFVYNPGDLEYSDRTDSYLESLGLGEKK